MITYDPPSQYLKLSERWGSTTTCHVSDVLIEPERRPNDRREALAIIHTGLGNIDEALRLFEQAVDERSVVPWWTRDPVFDRLRSDSRFTRLMRRMGLEQ